ncbi:MAG TPA: hypothetical protein VFV32_13725 [Acidimicrobiales bacterium]|jgi:hypothetical protein|nr:hypothetical protein [Acidimicrobiales bacterium]
MLAATQTPSLTIEHRRFAARSAADWDQLAADRATSDERTVFVLVAPSPPSGEGLLWCCTRPTCRVADLGWWWMHRPVEGTAAELDLYDAVVAWVAERGATTLASAVTEQREEASLVRAGFVHHGLAADGHRPLLVRRTLVADLVD